MEFKTTDVVDKTFNGLLVLEYLRTVDTLRKTNRYKHFYKLKCFCGKEFETSRSDFISGHLSSCGCLKHQLGTKNRRWKGHEEISGRFWNTIIKHAEKRKIKFDITIEQAWELYLKQNRKCALSGVDIPLKYRHNFRGDKKASLDRIDNEKGYTTDNVHWVHKDINWMKSDHELNKFLEMCFKVAKNNDLEKIYEKQI